MSDMSLAVQDALTPWYAGGGQRTNASMRHDARRFALELLGTRAYQEKLKDRLEKGDLAPAIESMLWHYAYGKPVEQIRVSVEQGPDLSTMTIEELEAQMAAMQNALAEAKDLASAIPAQYFVGEAP